MDQAPLTTYLVKQAESAIRAHLDRVLRPYGLTTAQYTALTALRHRDDLTSAQLARRAFVRPQTMHEMLLALEKQGLVARHPGQGRAVLVRLTPGGRVRLAECGPAVARVERHLVTGLSGPELAVLRGLLERCHEALRRPLELT